MVEISFGQLIWISLSRIRRETYKCTGLFM